MDGFEQLTNAQLEARLSAKGKLPQGKPRAELIKLLRDVTKHADKGSANKKRRARKISQSPRRKKQDTKRKSVKSPASNTKASGRKRHAAPSSSGGRPTRAKHNPPEPLSGRSTRSARAEEKHNTTHSGTSHARDAANHAGTVEDAGDQVHVVRPRNVRSSGSAAAHPLPSRPDRRPTRRSPSNASTQILSYESASSAATLHQVQQLPSPPLTDPKRRLEFDDKDGEAPRSKSSRGKSNRSAPGCTDSLVNIAVFWTAAVACLAVLLGWLVWTSTQPVVYCDSGSSDGAACVLCPHNLTNGHCAAGQIKCNTGFELSSSAPYCIHSSDMQKLVARIEKLATDTLRRHAGYVECLELPWAYNVSETSPSALKDLAAHEEPSVPQGTLSQVVLARLPDWSVKSDPAQPPKELPVPTEDNGTSVAVASGSATSSPPSQNDKKLFEVAFELFVKRAANGKIPHVRTIQRSSTTHLVADVPVRSFSCFLRRNWVVVFGLVSVLAVVGYGLLWCLRRQRRKQLVPDLVERILVILHDQSVASKRDGTSASAAVKHIRLELAPQSDPNDVWKEVVRQLDADPRVANETVLLEDGFPEDCWRWISTVQHTPKSRREKSPVPAAFVNPDQFPSPEPRTGPAVMFSS